MSEERSEAMPPPDLTSDSEERYRALVEAIPDMMFRVGRDGTYRDFVPAEGVEPLVPPEDFLGKTAYDVLPHDVASLCQAGTDAAIETRQMQTFEYVLEDDGETKYFEARVVPCGEDEALAIVRDVTEYRRTEEELERGRALISTAIESTAAAVFMYQEDGVVYSNPAAERMTGYSREELSSMNFVEIVHPDFRDMMRERVSSRISGGAAPTRYELLIVTKAGEERWMDCVIGGIVEFEGKPAIVGTAIDITERKRSEEALAQAREELEQRAERRSQAGSTYELTFRELTVLELMAEGKQDREIAELLGISHRTVQAHVANVLKKMSARTRTEASVRAQKEGLID